MSDDEYDDVNKDDDGDGDDDDDDDGDDDDDDDDDVDDDDDDDSILIYRVRSYQAPGISVRRDGGGCIHCDSL